jgi:hypothetical protein
MIAKRNLMQIKPRIKSLIKNQERIATLEFRSGKKHNISHKKTALIYCENQFGRVDGKTAAALVRHSEIYTIVGVIDSSLTGKDAGKELGEEKSGIPIFASLDDALGGITYTPDFYIYGKAPLETYIPNNERLMILEAMGKGMDIISGLHQFFFRRSRVCSSSCTEWHSN